MSAPAINITPGPWLERCKSFPISLPEACIWLAVAYSVPQLLGEQLIAQGLFSPQGWPENFLQLCIRGVLTVVFLIYFFGFRRGRAFDLGLSPKRLGHDVTWGLIACVVMAALYLLAALLFYFAVIWWTGRPEVFWDLIRRLPMNDLSIGHIISVVLVYPLLEELWFRALMYPAMRLHLGPLRAILLLSAIFGMAHGWPPVTQTIGGLAFAYAYEKRQTLWASIILHIAGNGILFVIGWAIRAGMLHV